MKFRNFLTIGTLAFALVSKTPAAPVPREISSRGAGSIVEVIGVIAEWAIGLIVPSFVEQFEALIDDQGEKGDFVQDIINRSMLYLAASDRLQGYNALVVNENHPYNAQFTEVVAQLRIHYKGSFFGINSATYRLFIFKGGIFYLNGDGGWANWGFTGGQEITKGVIQWS